MDVTAKALYDLADDILKIMPEFNMALTGVSEGAKGAMNIAPLVLKNFYAKSGFVGEGRLSRTLEGNKKPGSSGNPLQKLIPTNKTEFLSKLGITEDGKSRPGVKRGTPEANARMAMIREIGRFMTNTEGRLMLQEARVPHAFVVDTRAGMNAQMLNELGVDVSDVDLSNVETALKFLSSKDVKILLGYGQQNMIREYENATVEEKINLIEKLAERLSWHEKRKGLQEAVRIQIEDGLFVT